MGKFTSYRSYKKLQELAKNPLDLTKEGILVPERISRMKVEACGLKFLFGTQRIDETTLHALIDLAKESKAVEQMERMQRGDIMNTVEGFDTEDRPVLHTAVRDIFDSMEEEGLAGSAAYKAKREILKLESFLKRVEGEYGFTDLVQIGIGGSDLGPRAFCLALKAFNKSGRRVHFASNVDPDDIADVFKGLDLQKTVVLVVSKSGGTLETLTNEALAREQFSRAHLKPEEHFISVTGEGSSMDNPENYLESFYIWDYIGGRYSVTSMVGCVALGFSLGIEQVKEMLRGAHDMDRVALHPDVMQNLPLLSALIGIWNRNFLGSPTVAILPYSQALIRFTAHLQQCDMESNGKHIGKDGEYVDFETGPIVWGEPGTNGQHSFYQLIHQGTHDIPLEFIGFKESQYNEDMEIKGTLSQEKLLANLCAQSIALATGQKDANHNKDFKGNRPSSMLLGYKLSPYVLGAIMSFYEHKVAFQGFIWGINSFDQEGVQLGKVLANKIMHQFAQRRGKLEGKVESFPLGEALLEELDSLKREVVVIK
jgi:glucose-6-phosphate isomerase